ncbi:MAG: hypothetical protein ABIJ61_01055, partial [bacterium]
MSRPVYIVFMFALFCLLLTPALMPRSISPEELVSIKWLTHPELSPDGNRIAFQVRIADLEKSRYQQDIYLCDLVSGRTSELLLTDKDERAPQWSLDGAFLGFLSDRGDSSESEPIVQVWLLPLSGGEAKQLTESPTSIEQFRLSEDGKYIYYLAEQERPAPK